MIPRIMNSPKAISIVVLVLLTVLGCTGSQTGTVAQSATGQPNQATAVIPAATPVPTLAATPTQPAIATSAPEPTQQATQAPTATPEAIQEDLFLQLISPQGSEVFVSDPMINIAARTRVDAVVTVNDTLVEPGIDGRFSLEVGLDVGANIIEVAASGASGEQEGLVLVVIYLP